MFLSKFGIAFFTSINLSTFSSKCLSLPIAESKTTKVFTTFFFAIWEFIKLLILQATAY